MYRFLITRKTLLLLAAIWVVSGLLLFVAGWLLGHHQSAPSVDAGHLAEIFDATAPARAAAAEGAPRSEARRRDPRPWASPPPTTPPSPTSTASASAAPPSPPAGSASTPASTPPPTAAPPPPSTSAPPPASVPASSPPPPGTPSSPSPGATGETFSLQIGAFASEANARAQAEAVEGQGLAPYVVPVIDGARTLYTVRLGRYASRGQALAAADALRTSKGLAAVIRPVDPA